MFEARDYSVRVGGVQIGADLGPRASGACRSRAAVLGLPTAMPRPARIPLPLAAPAIAMLLLAISSCGSDRPAPTQPSTGVYDFALVDVNPTSPTVGDTLSISASLGKPVVLFVGAAT